MSLLSYGGVTFPYFTTVNCDQQAVYDDLSQTDWCLTKFDIRAQCTVNANYLTYIAPDLVGLTSDAADIMNIIRSRLLKPRQVLSLKVGGQDIIPQAAPEGRGNCDARQGPQPQSCTITQIQEATFLMTFHVVAHYWENNSRTDLVPVTNQPGNPVIFNRWTETVDINRLNQTTRTRDGKFVIRTDNKEGLTVDRLRGTMAFLGLPDGFERIQSRYTVDPGGLGLSYTITDQETFKRPPQPAYEADGEYIESTAKNGAMRWGQVRVYLKGSNLTSQQQLIDAAVAVATTKLIVNGAAPATVPRPGGGFRFGLLEHSQIMVKLFENHVECQMRCLMKPHRKRDPKKRVNGVAGLNSGDFMAFTPYSDGVNYTPAHYLRGSADVLLQAAAYYDPSLAAYLNSSTNQMSRGLEPGTAGLNLEPTT